MEKRSLSLSEGVRTKPELRHHHVNRSRIAALRARKAAIAATSRRQYCVIFMAVSAYWVVSISLVFLNKFLLSSPNLKLEAPLFIACYQCIVAVLLCYIGACTSSLLPRLVQLPSMRVDLQQSWRIMPLSLMFVGLMAFNSLCLKYMPVSFYYVGRSLTTLFNIICSYLILHQKTSPKALLCCGVIIGGFLLGVDQDESLTAYSVLYGLLASLCAALATIYTKKLLPTVGNSIWRLSLLNNLNASVLFLLIILLNGELLSELPRFEHLWSLNFWALMTLAGVFGFILGYVSCWQIQVTSALTHSISGNARSAAQTVLAVGYWNEEKSPLWWLSNIIVLLGSTAYTMVQLGEMGKKNSPVDRASPDEDPSRKKSAGLNPI